MLIDIHAHIIVPEIERAAAPSDRWRPAVTWENGRQICDFDGKRLTSMWRDAVNIERIIAENAAAGVTHAVLTPWSSLFGYELDLDKSRRVNQIQNDALARIQRGHPNQITALGTIPMQDADAAVAELERAVTQLGMKGVEIGTNVNGVYLGDDRFRPVWTAAQELGAIVEIHPVPGVGNKTNGQYYLWNAWANPAETAYTAAHMILAGVLHDFPDLKVVLFHGGGHLPYQIGRLDRAYAVRPEVQQRISAPPSTYFKKFYFDTITHSAEALQYLINLVGVDQVMVGSDYPFDMGYARPGEMVDALGLAGDAADKIRFGNATRLFGI
ncbi:MAG: amidohydrolase family protein [Caldilineaceae bacterium]